MNITHIQNNYPNMHGIPFQNLCDKFQAIRWDTWLDSLPIIDVRALSLVDLTVLYLANPVSAFLSELFLDLKNIKNKEFIEILGSVLRLFAIATILYFGFSFLNMLSTNAAQLLYRLAVSKNLMELQIHTNLSWFTFIVFGVIVYLWILAQYWYQLKIVLLHKNKTSMYITLVALVVFSTICVYLFREHWSFFHILQTQAVSNLVNIIQGLLYLLILLLPAVFYLFWMIISAMSWIGCTIVHHAANLTIFVKTP